MNGTVILLHYFLFVLKLRTNRKQLRHTKQCIMSLTAQKFQLTSGQHHECHFMSIKNCRHGPDVKGNLIILRGHILENNNNER